MVSAISVSGGRAAQSTAAAIAGALFVAAASVYILRTLEWRKRPPRPKRDADGGAGERRPGPSLSVEDLPPHLAREIEEERERDAKTSLKRPMYDNVLLLNRERSPMCTISAKKARWYVKKGLAEWKTLEERDEGHGDYEAGVRCIRFLFAENATGSNFGENMSDHLYLRSAKQNVCVGCGDGDRHRRHYVVPYSYRALLPREYKTHMSHDIVILCPDCHLICEERTKSRMQRMERELRARTGRGALDVPPVVEDPARRRIRSCAIALARRGRDGAAPEEELREHERVVREYLAGACESEEERELLLSWREELTRSQVQKACSIKCHAKNPAYLSPSEVVVRSLEDEGDVEEFIKGWRRHFVEALGPRHMPNGWSVNNPMISGKEARRSGKEGAKAW